MSLLPQKPQAPQSMSYMHEVDMALHRRGHPWAFTLSCAILLFFAVAFLWASAATIDDVTHGMGKVSPIQGVRKVQSDRGGTISRIFVKENELVESGQDIALIVNIDVVSGLQELQNRSIELDLSLERLYAEAKGIDLVYSDDTQKRYPQMVQAQMRIFNTRQTQFAGENDQLASQIEQRMREAQEAEERRQQYTERLTLLEQEEAKVRPLRGRSYSEIAYLELQQRLTTQKGELAVVEKTIARAKSAVTAAEARMNIRKAERQTSIATDSHKNRIELESIRQKMKAWSDQVTRTALKSPIKGTVKNLLLKENSVAKPAETIMEIIPTEGALEIVSRFKPADRGFLYVGQTGMAKFTAYDFSIHGGLDAKVESISEDTILDKRGEPWYEVHLLTKRSTLLSQGKELPILPGMTVSVDLLSDKRSVLNNLLGPLRRAQQTALTEH